MRETKDQKIVRLERKIKALESDIRKQRVKNRQFKKELKQDMNIKETSHKNVIINLNNEINRLTTENSRLEKLIIDLEEEKKTLKILLRNINKTKEEIRIKESSNDFEKQNYEDNEKRVKYWEMGLLEDIYGIKFIDPTILTLNINPNTGARLKPFSCIDISKTIKTDPLYIKKCNELYELKETVFR